jgi:phosphatidylserine decarboxylase
MIAREGFVLILAAAAITVILLAAGVRWSSLILVSLAGLFALATVFTTYFFRDPERTIDAQPLMLVAPADGTVLSVDTLDHHEFIGGKAVNIAIFLSVFDVHINRVPATGVVDFVDFHQGEFFAAFKPEASRQNQRTEIGITAESGHKYVVKQITGSVARRVICNLKPGDRVVTGDRFGLIRFGSRTELIVPVGSRIDVKKDDKVKGGETVVGFLPTIPESVLSDEQVERTNSEL